ncbi:hypothetical protein [Streptosporangium sp. NPDC002721]|uniref:hypothetical protein n=1 Tax=Streptosporangium sp. NPDC002721 TaxID=3366188 RepID=UPI0036BD4C27
MLGAAVFNNARLGATTIVTVDVDGSDATGGPVGGVPEATAVFTTEPESMSACVIVYVLVQVVVACGASVVTGQLITAGGPEPEKDVSATLKAVSVVLPVLTTR